MNANEKECFDEDMNVKTTMTVSVSYYSFNLLLFLIIICQVRK